MAWWLNKINKKMSLSGLIFLTLTSGTLSCGKVDQARQIDPDQDFFATDDGTDAKSALVRTWEGVLKDKRDGDQTERIPVKMEFKEDMTFQIKTTDDSEASAKGTFRRFPDIILFSTKTSSISIFGLGGSQQDINYNLLGKTLKIYSNSMELILASTSGGGASSSSIVIPPESPIVGSWKGTDTKENTWEIVLQASGVFAIQVSNDINNTLQMGGNFEFTEETSKKIGTLKIEQSNNTEMVGSILKFELSIEGTVLEITVIDKEGNEVQTFSLEKSDS